MSGNTITAVYRIGMVAALWAVLLTQSCTPEPAFTATAKAHPQKTVGHDDREGEPQHDNTGKE